MSNQEIFKKVLVTLCKIHTDDDKNKMTVPILGMLACRADRMFDHKDSSDVWHLSDADLAKSTLEVLETYYPTTNPTSSGTARA